ncbi:MAG: ribonuclease P protein component [Alphaproteobacteria bacterium]|nr:ribonuclease P protein component [Alphaproteobacteria bacterium]
MQLQTLKKRQDFLRVRGGRRCQNAAFVMETKPRESLASTDADSSSGPMGPRFGFTITKKIGNAVTRNRIRRRLKHAIGQLAKEFAQPGYDYIIVARRSAATEPYVDLKKALERCFQRVHDARVQNHRR